MLIGVLGPIVVGGDHERSIPAAKVRALLAALVIARGTTVSADRLIDALWGDAPPASAAKLLQVYVSQLRRQLPAGVAVETRSSGYELVVPPHEVDAVRFEELATDGRRALANHNPQLAAAMLRRALDLWRGSAYAEVRYEPFADEEVMRLEARRTSATLDRIEADLELGQHEAALGELRALLASDPYDERAAALAMVAALRTTGSRDALAVFESVRRALAEDVGAEPGPALSALARRIADGDPGLAAMPPARAPVPALPVPPNALVGREQELRDLHALVARPGVRLVSLTGAGGSGKSRLGLELALELASRFANGAVLVELASLRDPALVMSTIARSLGVDPGVDAFETVRSALATRQQLLLIDNLEHLRTTAPDLVRLLAAAPQVVIVVTTRVVLHVSGEHVFPVGPLDEPAAVALFAERATALDPTFVLDATTEPIAARVVNRVDRLPLPIELAAARVRTLGLKTLDLRLASRLGTLTAGPRDLPARQQTLRETLAWSVNLLGPRDTAVLGALAVFPGGCGIDAAVRVAGADDETLSALVDHHLVQASLVDGEHRYRLLETVREFAFELLGSNRERTEMAMVEWLRDAVASLDLMADAATAGAAYRFLDTELDTVRDAFAVAARSPDGTHELALAAGIWRYWWVRGHLAEARAVLDAIVERRGLMATRDGIRTVRAQAAITWSMGESEAARRIAAMALVAAEQIDDLIEQSTLHNLLGVLANGDEDVSTATLHFERSAALALAAERPDLAATARTNLAGTYLRARRLDDARDLLADVLEYRDARGEIEAVGYVHYNLGEIEFNADRLDAAERHFRAAIPAFRQVGFHARIANSLQGLAAVESHTGRPEPAARRLGQASALLGETGWGADGTALAPDAMASAREALGDERFEVLFREGLAAPLDD